MKRVLSALFGLWCMHLTSYSARAGNAIIEMDGGLAPIGQHLIVPISVDFRQASQTAPFDSFDITCQVNSSAFSLSSTSVSLASDFRNSSFDLNHSWVIFSQNPANGKVSVGATSDPIGDVQSMGIIHLLDLDVVVNANATPGSLGPIVVKGTFSPWLSVDAGVPVVSGSAQFSLETVPPTWNTATSGSWIDATKWTSNPNYPNGIGQQAVIGAATTSSYSISLDGNQTVGQLVFSNSASNNFGYTLSNGTLTLSNTGSAAQINVNGGNHVIATPVIVAENLAVMPATGTNLSITGNIESTGLNGSLLLDGPGNLLLTGSNEYSGGTTVTSGVLLISSASALPAGRTLSIGEPIGTDLAPADTFTSLLPIPGTPIVSDTVSEMGGDAALTPAGVPEPCAVILLVVGGLMGIATWRGVVCRAAKSAPS